MDLLLGGHPPNLGLQVKRKMSVMALLAAVPLQAQVVPARAQMATTLGFHIILACFGIALPTFVLLAEFIGLRRHNDTAMKRAVPVGEFITNRQFGYDFVHRQMRDLNAQQIDERRLNCSVRIHGDSPKIRARLLPRPDQQI